MLRFESPFTHVRVRIKDATGMREGVAVRRTGDTVSGAADMAAQQSG